MSRPPAVPASTGGTARRAVRVALPILAAITVTAALVAGWAITRSARLAAPAWTPAPAGGPFLPWPVVGNATTDRDLVQRAIHAWDTSGQPEVLAAHTDVRPLLIQTGTPAGPVVILQGNDQGGTARTAILTGTTGRGTDAPLYLRADRRAPDPRTTRQISMVTARLTDQIGSAPQPGSPVLAMVLADPDTTHIRLTSSVAADEGPQTVRGRLAITALHHRANAFTTTISGNGREQPWTSYADDATIGEPRAHPVKSIGKPDDGHLTIRLPDAYAGVTARPLVTSRRGVIGQINRLEINVDGTVTVELLSHPGFSLGIRTPADEIQLMRTTPTGMELVNGRDRVREGQPVFAVQDTNEGGNDAIYLPLAVAGPPSTVPKPDNSQWNAATTPLQPLANLDATTQLYLIAPTA